MDFQSGKSFGKLRLRAFQPYHQILCILKHVGDVGDRSSTPKGYVSNWRSTWARPPVGRTAASVVKHRYYIFVGGPGAVPSFF